MASTRFDTIDALRGFAMVWMTVFHFCFDLNHFKIWPQDFFNDPFWTLQRTAILSLFLFCAGLGQAIATVQGQSWARFWRRWAQVAGAALLVSAGSYLMYPETFIYFGVLHGMAVMLLIVRLTAHWGKALWWLGLLGVSMFFVANYSMNPGAIADLLNSKSLNWLGFVNQKPRTEDYVPLIPWLGVMWWGVAAGTWVLSHRPQWLQSQFSPEKKGPVSGVQRGLSWLGRRSLVYYLLHQPIMIGALMAYLALAR